MHVRRGGDEAKFWLQPEVAVADSFGFNAAELNALLRMVTDERARIRERGMDISATAVRFDDNSMWVELSDGRTLSVPYAWFPRLLNATSKQREAVEIGRFGLHWDPHPREHFDRRIVGRTTRPDGETSASGAPEGAKARMRG